MVVILIIPSINFNSVSLNVNRSYSKKMDAMAQTILSAENNGWTQWLYSDSHNSNLSSPAPMEPYLLWSEPLNNTTAPVNNNFPYNPSPLVYNNTVYMNGPGTHDLYAYNLTTGKLVWWANSTTGSSALPSNYYFNETDGIGIVNDSIYVAANGPNQAGYFYIFNASTGGVSANPSSANGRYMGNLSNNNNNNYVSSPFTVISKSGYDAVIDTVANSTLNSYFIYVFGGYLGSTTKEGELFNKLNLNNNVRGPDISGVTAVKNGTTSYDLFGFYNFGSTNQTSDQIIKATLSYSSGLKLNLNNSIRVAPVVTVVTPQTTGAQEYATPIYFTYGKTGYVAFFYQTSQPTLTSTIYNTYMTVYYESNMTEKSNTLLSSNQNFNIYGTPVIANGYVYMPMGNTLYNISLGSALSNNNNITEGTFNTSGAITASPVIANNVIYLASQSGYIYALNASLLKNSSDPLIWAYKTAGPIYSSPVVADGKLIIYSHGILYVFAIPEITGYVTPDSLNSSYITSGGSIVTFKVRSGWENTTRNPEVWMPIDNGMVKAITYSGGNFSGNSKSITGYTDVSGMLDVNWTAPAVSTWLNATIEFVLSSGNNVSYFKSDIIYDEITVRPAPVLSIKWAASPAAIYLDKGNSTVISARIFNRSNSKAVSNGNATWTLVTSSYGYIQPHGSAVKGNVVTVPVTDSYTNVSFNFTGTIVAPENALILLNVSNNSYINGSTYISIPVMPGNDTAMIAVSQSVLNLNYNIDNSVINITAVTGTGKPIGGMNISVNLSDPLLGTINRTSAKADQQGYALFSFNASWNTGSIETETFYVTIWKDNYSRSYNSTIITIIPSSINVQMHMSKTWIRPGESSDGVINIFNASSGSLYKDNLSITMSWNTGYGSMIYSKYTSNGSDYVKFISNSAIINPVKVNFTITASNITTGITAKNYSYIYILPQSTIYNYSFFNLTITPTVNPIHYNTGNSTDITFHVTDGVNGSAVKHAVIALTLYNGSEAELVNGSKIVGIAYITTDGSGNASIIVNGNRSFYGSVMDWLSINITDKAYIQYNSYYGIDLVGAYTVITAQNGSLNMAYYNYTYLNGTVSINKGISSPYNATVELSGFNSTIGTFNTTKEMITGYKFTFKFNINKTITSYNGIERIKISVYGPGLYGNISYGFVQITMGKMEISVSGLPGEILLNNSNKISFKTIVKNGVNNTLINNVNLTFSLTDSSYGSLLYYKGITPFSNEFIASNLSRSVIEGMYITASMKGYFSTTIFTTITIIPAKVVLYRMGVELSLSQNMVSLSSLTSINVTAYVYNASDNLPLQGASVSFYLSDSSVAYLSNNSTSSNSNGIATTILNFMNNGSIVSGIENIYATVTSVNYYAVYNETSLYLESQVSIKPIDLVINSSSYAYSGRNITLYINATSLGVPLTGEHVSILVTNKSEGYIIYKSITKNGSVVATFHANYTTKTVVETFIINATMTGYYLASTTYSIYIYNKSSVTNITSTIGLNVYMQYSYAYSTKNDNISIYAFNSANGTPLYNVSVNIYFTPSILITNTNLLNNKAGNGTLLTTNKFGYVNITLDIAKVTVQQNLFLTIKAYSPRYRSVEYNETIAIYPLPASGVVSKTSSIVSMLYSFPFWIIILLSILIIAIGVLIIKKRGGNASNTGGIRPTSRNDKKLKIKSKVVKDNRESPKLNIGRKKIDDGAASSQSVKDIKEEVTGVSISEESNKAAITSPKEEVTSSEGSLAEGTESVASDNTVKEPINENTTGAPDVMVESEIGKEDVAETTNKEEVAIPEQNENITNNKEETDSTVDTFNEKTELIDTGTNKEVNETNAIETDNIKSIEESGEHVDSNASAEEDKIFESGNIDNEKLEVFQKSEEEVAEDVIEKETMQLDTDTGSITTEKELNKVDEIGSGKIHKLPRILKETKEEVGTVPEEETKEEVGTVPENETKEEVDTVPEKETKEEEGTVPEEETKEKEGTVPEEETKEEEGTVPEEETKDIAESNKIKKEREELNNNENSDFDKWVDNMEKEMYSIGIDKTKKKKKVQK